MVLSADEGARVSQEALGGRVAHHLNDPRPVAGATVSRWETGESVPDLETLAAIGAVCRVDPGWIAFGSASNAADPRDAIIKGGLGGQSHARAIDFEILEVEASRLIEEKERNEDADRERLRGFAKARRLIEQIENSAERKARRAQFHAEVREFKASAKKRDAELTQRIRATSKRRFKLLFESLDALEALEAELAAEKARRASSKRRDADQERRRTSGPEPKTLSKAKAGR
jgi:hypothetical protein